MFAQTQPQTTPKHALSVRTEKAVMCQWVKQTVMPETAEQKPVAQPQPVRYDFVGIAG